MNLGPESHKPLAVRFLAGAVFWLLTLSLATASDSARAPAVEAMTIRQWENLWSDVLRRHVDPAGRIDFSALAKDHAGLDRVVGFIATVDPATQPERFPDRSARLAYYINAYNALAMHGVLEEGVPDDLGGWTKFRFFYLKEFKIGGTPMSLYSFENHVIRPLGEERIHFALNCMVVSCPRLPRTAFHANTLEQQLDAAAHAFVAEQRNVSVDPTTREVWLSAIFDFYTEDFLAHAPSLIDYVNRYRAQRIPADFRVRFLDYDWTVNDRSRVARNAG